MRDGQQVEALSRLFVDEVFAGRRVQSQVTFKTDTLLARADFISIDGTGLVDLIEVKASTKLKIGGNQDHVADAAFQVLTAERQGVAIERVFLIHLNADYRRHGDLELTKLFVIADVTQLVRDRLVSLSDQIDFAAQFSALSEIDQDGCDCLFASAATRCDAFDHFNPSVPSDSAHHLPRISPKKLQDFKDDFSLHTLDPSNLSSAQALVHRACVEGTVVNRAAIDAFLNSAQFPLHFYDYETTGPAIPPHDHYRPYQALPVQFSLHRMSTNGSLEHFEWLANDHGQQLQLIKRLEACVSNSGSAIAWHKSFENGCNRRLSEIFPDKADFLSSLSARTIDLEEPFKHDYVDWGFRGSSSIKKVLPVLCPELNYSQVGVHDGTGAVEAWHRMIDSADAAEKAELRRQLLEYCKTDSLAMVRIWQCLIRTTEEKPESKA